MTRYNWIPAIRSKKLGEGQTAQKHLFESLIYLFIYLLNCLISLEVMGTCPGALGVRQALTLGEHQHISGYVWKNSTGKPINW